MGCDTIEGTLHMAATQPKPRWPFEAYGYVVAPYLTSGGELRFCLTVLDVPHFFVIAKSQAEAVEKAKKQFPQAIASWRGIKPRPIYAPESRVLAALNENMMSRTTGWDASGKFTLRLPSSLHARLRRCAAMDGVSIRRTAATMLAAGLKSPSRTSIRTRKSAHAVEPATPSEKAVAFLVHMPRQMHSQLILNSREQRTSMSLLAITLLAQQIAAWEATHGSGIQPVPASKG